MEIFMKESYFMGIDTGTNSSKGVLINSHGEIIAEHTTEHAMTNPAPGHYEHDADKDWWGDLCIISNALIEKSKVSPSDIKAIGTSALGADCLPVDDQCRPLRKAIRIGHTEQFMRTIISKLTLTSIRISNGCQIPLRIISISDLSPFGILNSR